MENKETLLPNPTILTDSSIDAHIQAAMQATLLSEAEKERIFDREFVPQMSALYNFAYYLCRDETQAEDMLQETMMRCYEHIESYREGSNAKAWLFRILKNNFLNENRKIKSSPKITEIDDIKSYHESDEGDRYVDLRQEMFQDMMGDEVKEALESLEPIFREVILLYDIEHFTYQEIANDILHIPIGTVRSRLNRARSLMRVALWDYAKKEGFNKLDNP
jgi:RNA polymerase sigma factor (sigma-70 family)